MHLIDKNYTLSMKINFFLYVCPVLAPNKYHNERPQDPSSFKNQDIIFIYPDEFYWLFPK